ncbi:unnamed protein product [Caenorhabditis bovis]|uniref:Uncharacterized protein n=1 Tax=Caenorhabditis bovis TaxID=2654633 RepID=A0A8S1ETG0_9PELO|nr:unnamed protein product [Caenorhabditis bovis]
MVASSMVPLVFPGESLKAIRGETRQFLETHFSAANYLPTCQYDAVLTPIYYFAGDRVALECNMCDVGLVFNGRPKRWARVENVTEFLAKSHLLGTDDGPLVEFVANDDDDGNSTTNPIRQSNFFDAKGQRIAPHVYRQDRGFLFIEQAHPLAGGVYFCFDDQSRASQRHFYIVIALAPPVEFQQDSLLSARSGGCQTSKRIYPNFNLVNEPLEYGDQAACFRENGYDDWSCYDQDEIEPIDGCENPAASCKVPIRDETLPLEVKLSLTLKWSEWSECRDHYQSRDGHCYLKLDKSIPPTAALSSKWAWLRELNDLGNHVAFRDGVPLFSTLVARWMYGVARIHSCVDAELGGKLEMFDTIFRTAILPAMNLEKHPNNAFKYCMSNVQIMDLPTRIGRYVIQKRQCQAMN